MNFTIVKGPLLDYIFTYNYGVFETWLQIFCQLSHQVIPSLLNFSKSRCCLTNVSAQPPRLSYRTQHKSLSASLSRSFSLSMSLSVYLSTSLSPFHLSVCLLTMEVCNILKVSMINDHLWKDTYTCLRSPSSSSPPAI